MHVYIIIWYTYITIYTITLYYYCSSLLLSKNMFDHFFCSVWKCQSRISTPQLDPFFSAVWMLYNKIRRHSCPIDRDGWWNEKQQMPKYTEPSVNWNKTMAFPLSKCRRSHGVPLQVLAPGSFSNTTGVLAVLLLVSLLLRFGVRVFVQNTGWFFQQTKKPLTISGWNRFKVV